MGETGVRFGDLVLIEDFATESQVEECIELQERLRAEKRDKRIGKIMVRQGVISRDQAEHILRLQQLEDPIEGYKLLERIGTGGMGVVYRALQKSLKREVALKILSPRWAGHERFRTRFFREARLAAQLKHPNVVQALDVGESNGLCYYAMEYVDGPSAKEVLRERGSLPEAEGLDLAIQITRALEHADQFKIVHRDVKPDNIMIGSDGVAKLGDFGLSKQLTADCHITTVGMTVGTPFYIAPELARGEPATDTRSDIYSLGCTLHHLLTGSPPYVAQSVAEIMAMHAAEDVDPPAKSCTQLSRPVRKLLEKMMAKDVRRRYQSAGLLLRDLVAVRKGKDPFKRSSGRNAPVRTPSSTPATGFAPAKPRWGRAALAAALAFALALPLAGYAATRLLGSRGAVGGAGGQASSFEWSVPSNADVALVEASAPAREGAVGRREAIRRLKLVAERHPGDPAARASEMAADLRAQTEEEAKERLPKLKAEAYELAARESLPRALALARSFVAAYGDTPQGDAGRELLQELSQSAAEAWARDREAVKQRLEDGDLRTAEEVLERARGYTVPEINAEREALLREVARLRASR